MFPHDFFREYEVSEVSEWSKYSRYHDVHVTESDYVITSLDPTIYTAWCLYNTQSAIPSDYIEKLRSWGYRVCYFRNQTPIYYTHPVKTSEPLRQPITQSLTSDLFPDTEFTHRVLL